jgi:Tol biopolymer transport system component
MRSVYAAAALLSAALIIAAPPAGSASRAAGLIALSRCRPDGCGEGTDLWVMRQDATGLRRLTRRRTHNDAPTWSPDGKRLAFVGGDKNSSQLWVINVSGGHLEQLTRGPALDEQPAWSPDGKRIAFVRALSETTQGIVVLNLQTKGQRLVASRPGTYRHPTWSPDGQQLAFSYVRHPRSGRYAIFVVRRDGTGLRRISRNPHDDYWDPSWSPSGRRIAFTLVYPRGKGYRADLEVMQADGRAQRTVARAPAGWAYFSPSWSPDGAALVFVELHSSDGMGRISFVDVSRKRVQTLGQLLSDNRAPAWQPS